MEDFFTLSLLILMAAAFVAGFIDAIAGGGGLITVPALIASRNSTSRGPCHQQTTGNIRVRFSGIYLCIQRIR